MEKLSGVLKQDLRDIAGDENIDWNALRERAVMVTGATGLVGGALVRALWLANASRGLNLRLLAHGRNRDKAGELPRGTEFISGDLRKPVPADALPARPDYIFHCAAVTKSADMVSKPAEVISAAVDGTKNMLELARDKGCAGFVYLSSMEIYGRTELAEVTESDLGYLDLSSPRSSYPESKRLCEALCVAYAAQYGVPARTARLAQTFGAGTPREDTRVFAQFARSAMEGKDIELHTEGKSRGNYCYTADTVRGLLTILLKGGNGEAYNVANPAASMTIREMAGLVADEICGGKIRAVTSVPEDVKKRGYAPDTGFTLNADKLKKLGWLPRYGLADMYRRMLDDWRERETKVAPL